MAPIPRHLTTGDTLPPLQPGVLRIYSMKFCPFADRARLVLHAKGIAHEVVNVNTYKKPEWFVEKNPNQLVPVLEKDDKIVYESLICCDHLEDLFPDKNPLRQTDVYLKARDAMFLNFFEGKIIAPFFGSARAKGKDAALLEKLTDVFQKMEDELKKRGTDYYYGSKPGLVDYAIWPLFARVRSSSCFGEGQDLPASMTVISAWVMRMLRDKSVQSILHPDNAYAEFSKHYRTENTKFDEIDTPH